MFDADNLAKYSTNQIEGELRYLKKRHWRFWVLFIIFITLSSTCMGLSIILLSIYLSNYIHNDLMFILSITTSVLFLAFLVPSIVIFILDRVWHINIIRKLETYLKGKLSGK